MVQEVEVTLHIVFPALVGIIIGIIEAYFVYEDENMTSGRDFLGDMWHGLIFAFFGVITASNVPWIISQGWIPEWFNSFLMVDELGRSIVISLIIMLFMMVKMVVSHSIKGIKGGGFSEKLWHKVLVSALIGFAPYYIFALYNIEFVQNLEGLIPWLPF